MTQPLAPLRYPIA